MRLLSAADVQAAVSMPEAINAVEAAFVRLSAGYAEVPIRTHVDTPAYEATSLFMPARLDDATHAALGMKVVSIFPQNAARGEPTIYALVTLLDPATGRPVALLDGTYLTALRTGAASGVATRHLARPDARVLALFGAGAQALPQALAVWAERPLERIWLVNRSRQRAEGLAQRMREAGITCELRFASTADEALAEAEIVCTATSATDPLFGDTALRKGVHINAIGAYRPTMAEIPLATVARARVVVDQAQAAWAEAGELVRAHNAGLITPEQIVGELGAVAAGIVVGRTTDEEVTLFKSVGNAVQDLAVAHLAWQRACELNLGVEVALME
ncbi:MAG: ornithine cyclodeaminase [Chloroflexia bacterium]|nr:ornithine cyclodeaminase [Chloroflexia bacterium]